MLKHQDSDPSIAEASRDEHKAALRDGLAAFVAGPASSPAVMRNLQKGDPGLFAFAALRLLGSAEPSQGLKVVARFVASDDLTIDTLLTSDETSLPEAGAATSRLNEVDSSFDVRMLRRVLQDFGEVGDIPTPLALRLLQILDQGPNSCSKLTSPLIRFMRHPSEKVRSKSVLLLGRGNHNLRRTLEYLSSQEARVRANAVESLWGHQGEDTRRVLVECAQDPNQRVMLNALVGLCRMGDSKSATRLITLAASENPVIRAGAAWGMGQLNRADVVAEFSAALATLSEDSDQKVQNMARKSLEALGSQAVAVEAPGDTPGCGVAGA